MTSSLNTDITSAAAIIKKALGRAPRAAIVLGSGLGALAEAVNKPTIIPYAELPGFPQPTVHGHSGQLVLGDLGGVPVAVMQGRAHFYEHGRSNGMRSAILSFKESGCPTLLLTNAAGSLKSGAGPGSLMLLTDHINLAGTNPLFGESGSERFVDMANAYDPSLRAGFLRAAEKHNIPLHEGIYAWFSGPSFETPAEIRAARVLGADAVGMSTAPEVILARWAGLQVAAVSVLTNYAAGMGAEPLSHQQTLTYATAAAQNLKNLMVSMLEDLNRG